MHVMFQDGMDKVMKACMRGIDVTVKGVMDCGVVECVKVWYTETV